MRTPSLRRRVLAAGSAVFLLVVVALEIFIAANLRGQLERNLEEILESRVQVAQELAREVEADELPTQLAALGVPAVIVTEAGERRPVLPAIPQYEAGPPGPSAGLEGPLVSEVVALPDGGHIEVLATRAGVDATMRRVLWLMVVGTVLALVVGALLLQRAAAAAIAPLGEIGAAARRTAGGLSGERLHPDDPRTELGRLAVAYDDMLDSLEAAVERAHAEEERTRRFLDDAAHQLRTPIAAVRASVEALLSTADPAMRDRIMAHLVRETSRSSRVLRDLLTMARLDTGKPPVPRPTDLARLCGDEVERTQSLAPELEVTCTGPATGEAQAHVDPAGIQEAVANLLDNARRHARGRIEVTVSDGDQHWRIRVRDDGPGVDREARELIFERFATLDGLGGSGLGLPIARTVLRAHGGDLRCDDEGFLLVLPKDASPAAPSAAADVSGRASAPSPGA